MASVEEWTEMTEGAMKGLAAEGNEWPSSPEVALAYMKRHPNFLKKMGSRRQLAADRARSLLYRPSTEDRAPYKYRHESGWGLIVLEGENRLEVRFKDSQGRLRKDPPRPRSANDRRYRLLPEAAGNGEMSPQNRFENIARRIEALPGAITEGEGQEAVTMVSASVPGHQNDPRTRPVTLDLQVAYLPSCKDATERDPLSIVASWNAPKVAGGTATRDEYLPVSQLQDGGLETDRILGVLENSVRAVELTHISAAAEAESRGLFRQVFVLPEPAGAARRYPGPPEVM